jgi:DNA-binding CsgD family transcriptional regulator
MAAGNGTKTKAQWTPTQSRILKLLSDGMPHEREEIFKCLNDELSAKRVVFTHLSDIRRVLRPLGQDILTELFEGIPHYRWVVLLGECTCRKVLI